MDVILIMLGIIFGVGLLTILGCFLYYYEEDKKLDREAAHNLAYVKKPSSTAVVLRCSWSSIRRCSILEQSRSDLSRCSFEI